jgi:hypothetical protein
MARGQVPEWRQDRVVPRGGRRPRCGWKHVLVFNLEEAADEFYGEFPHIE